MYERLENLITNCPLRSTLFVLCMAIEMLKEIGIQSVGIQGTKSRGAHGLKYSKSTGAAHVAQTYLHLLLI